jgi:hypothetical protein
MVALMEDSQAEAWLLESYLPNESMSYTSEEPQDLRGQLLPWQPEIVPCPLRSPSDSRLHGQVFGFVHHDFRPEKCPDFTSLEVLHEASDETPEVTNVDEIFKAVSDEYHPVRCQREVLLPLVDSKAD